VVSKHLGYGVNQICGGSRFEHKAHCACGKRFANRLHLIMDTQDNESRVRRRRFQTQMSQDVPGAGDWKRQVHNHQIELQGGDNLQKGISVRYHHHRLKQSPQEPPNRLKDLLVSISDNQTSVLHDCFHTHDWRRGI
jgi:hypothetical protein